MSIGLPMNPVPDIVEIRHVPEDTAGLKGMHQLLHSRAMPM